MTPALVRTALIAVVGSLMPGVSLALGQDAEPGDAPPPPAESQPDRSEQADSKTPLPPTLDELLGLEEDAESTAAEETAQRENEEELQRKLDEKQIGDVFAEAVRKMRLSADLLDHEFDSGLGTQRVQEDILRKLDQLIDFARQQQSSGGGSSNSSKSQQQSKQNPGQRESQAPGEQRGSGASEGQATDAPPGQGAEVGTLLEETQSEWGNLPPRVRNQLLQGRSDKYSRLYEQLTNEYYRRLAEEGS